MAGRLVLVTAPAGWGKSSVLAEWAQNTALDVAWVDCVRYGDASHRLVKGIVSALETVCPDFGKELFAMLRSPRPLPAPQLFSVLADALEDYGQDVALVLDDFHAVRDDEAVQAVFGLASAGPRHLRVLVSSRMTPPWHIARMRVTGEVTEIGSRDLAFSDDEIREFLNGLTTTDEIVTALGERSGGWAAGVQLAKLWMLGNPGQNEVTALFAHTHRNIADYMTEEVMAQLSPEVRRFLYATGLVERFSLELARAMLRSGDIDGILNLVERHDLFLIPEDAARRWYRYHDVFRDFLRSRAAVELGDAVEELVERAASWFRDHGHVSEAASCFLRLGMLEDAGAVLDGCAERLLLRDGDAVTLIGLAEQLPPETLYRHQELQRFYAWALVLVGRLDDAERIAFDLDARSSLADPDTQRFVRSEAASIRARIAAYRGDHEATIRNGLQALQCGDEAKGWFRAEALLSLGFAYRALGQLSEACDAFGRASELGWSTRFANAALWGSRYQALTFVSRGQLETAWWQIERDMERARAAGMTHGAAYAALLVGRGELLYERNDLTEAREDLTNALRLAREAGDAKILMNVHVALAKLRAAKGQGREAREAARTAVRVFDGTGEKAVEAWLAHRDEDLPGVRRWMDTYLETVGDTPSFRHGETEQLMLARAFLATRQLERARMFLGQLLGEADASDRAGTAMAVRTLFAHVAELEGDRDEADRYVRDVMDLAMRERYVRTILDEGPAFLDLIRRAARHDPSPARREYARALITAAEPMDPNESGSPANGENGLLTDRQTEVLQLMISGLSNREIADALYLAEGTVKAHMNQIYTRLTVRNRAEAIRAAQRLGIVP